jgi:hypothetical protein
MAAKRRPDTEHVQSPCHCGCPDSGTPWFAQMVACVCDCHFPNWESAPYLGTSYEMAEQWRAEREAVA